MNHCAAASTIRNRRKACSTISRMLKPLEVLRLYPDHDYTLAGAFVSRARRDPQRPFIVFNGKIWSWAEFGAAVASSAHFLVARGVRKGDRVGVLARNDIGHALILFACARIGAIMVPSNPEFLALMTQQWGLVQQMASLNTELMLGIMTPKR